MVIDVIPAQAGHILHIAENIRAEDKKELWDYALQRPYEGIWKSLDSSRFAWTGLVDEKPACMFGVSDSSCLSEVGRPWLIGTEEIDKRPLSFLRRNKHYLPVMMLPYERLENYVEESNVRAIEWLGWLGFTFGAIEYIGPFMKPFYKFWMVKDALS